MGRHTSSYVSLTGARKEPAGWPLTRRATAEEWGHTVKAMLVRRVPKTAPIPRSQLVGVIADDVKCASDAGRIYVGPNFVSYIKVADVLSKLIDDKVLRICEMETGMDTIRGTLGVIRTEFTDEWERLIPVTVRAILKIMPTSDPLDRLVDALIDAER